MIVCIALMVTIGLFVSSCGKTEPDEKPAKSTEPADTKPAPAPTADAAKERIGADAGNDKVLIDFDRNKPPAAVETNDVKVSTVNKPNGAVLRVASGHQQDCPDVTFKAPGGRWDFSEYGYLAMDVANAGSQVVSVRCRVDNPGSNGTQNCNYGRLDLKPGEKGVLRVVFARRPSGIKLFGMYKTPWDLQTIDPTQVSQVMVYLSRPRIDHLFDLDNIRVGGIPTPPVEEKTFFPFIDMFGQYIHKDWPGKTHSMADLDAHLEAEKRDLVEHPGPADWDEFGGWERGPTLKATGFFRTEKYRGKWWLVDPKGRLFFSHGIDCVHWWDGTPLEERDGWFAYIPVDDADYREFFMNSQFVLGGHYAGRFVRCFDFEQANLRRKYGRNWRALSAETAHRRLRSWGMNTIGMWSEPGVYLMQKTPYVVSIYREDFKCKVIEGSPLQWMRFRDVFDPDFKDKIRKRMAEDKLESANDPWCIGYFVDNELPWGDEVSLSLAALGSPPDQVAKKVFIEDLKAKYGTIEALNQTWGSRHESWQALLEHRGAPDKKKAYADLATFYTKAAETYFKTIREAIKEVAPNHLYLGCRFSSYNDQASKAAAKYCDAVSYNLYWRDVSDFKLPQGVDTPVIIGEWNFGANDRGTFDVGMVAVENQDERALMYESYARSVLRNPLFVGCHWYQYRDNPTVGRPVDGENQQVGFLDSVDTPYPETVQACRKVGYDMYDIRLSEGSAE